MRYRRAALLGLAPLLLGGFALARRSGSAHPPGGPATSPDTVVAVIPAGSIEAALQSLAHAASDDDIARELSTGDSSRYQLFVLSRRVAARGELHERWTDVVLVRAGQAVLRTGHALSQRQPRAPGEWLGTVAGGQERGVGPGDLVVIPAGMAHQWLPTGEGRFAYLVMKVKTGGGSTR